MRRILLVAAICLPAACGDMTPPSAEGDTGKAADQVAEVVPANQAIHKADIASTDPQTMNEAEIAEVLERDLHCRFAYTEAGGPVLAVNVQSRTGVMKLHSALIELRAASGQEDIASGVVMQANGLRATVDPLADGDAEMRDGRRQWQADMRLELDAGLKAAYRGFYSCAS